MMTGIGIDSNSDDNVSDKVLSRCGCSKQNVTLHVCKNTESQLSTDVPTGT
jgi:hypothetical protein